MSERALTHLSGKQPAWPRLHTSSTKWPGFGFPLQVDNQKLQFALTEPKRLTSGISFWISFFPYKGLNTLSVNYVLHFGRV